MPSSPPPPRLRPPSPPFRGAGWVRAGAIVAVLAVCAVVGLRVTRTLVGSLPVFPRWTTPEDERASGDAGPVEDRTPEIKGRVLDADGNPVGATVRLLSRTVPPTLLHEATSDATGGFSFAHVSLEPVRVVAEHVPEGVASSGPMLAKPGETEELTLVLAPSTVRGQVVDGDAHPIAGVALSVEGVPWPVEGATTDDAGGFRIVAVPDDARSILATARGYEAARAALGPRSDGADRFVHIRLATAPTVTGEVHDVDGVPIRAGVVACEGLPSEAHTTSADDGSFQLPPSTIGCDAVARHDDYAPSDAVAVIAGRPLALRLRAGGAIEGTVVDEQGKALPSFSVGVEASSMPPNRRGGGRALKPFDGPRGAFRLEKLEPGRYVLTAMAPGKAPVRSESIDVSSGGVTAGVRMVLVQGGSVVGRVYDERRVPLAGVDVRFDAVSSVVDGTAVAKTDDGGQYRLDGAPSGPFTLRAQKDGFRVRLLSGLRVDPRATLSEDVMLTLVDAGGGLEFGGIGANLVQTPDGIGVGAVFDGDPAARAGLRAGDRIVRIDGEDVDDMSIADVLQRLRGQEGTMVGVTVRHAKTDEAVDVMIPRAAIIR